MTAQSLSYAHSLGNSSLPINFDFLNENTPAVLSTDVALRFQRKHQHVLRDIERIRPQVPKIFFESNFGQSFRETETGFGTVRKFPTYLLTRDAFSLLVMGFTGSAAIRWKIKYIEAFNALEATVLQNQAELARQSGYAQGLAEAQSYPGIKIATRRAYLEGLTEGQGDAAKLRRAPEALLQLHPQRLRTLQAALRYARMGLSGREIAKILDANHRQIGHLLSLARKVGLLAPWQQLGSSVTASACINTAVPALEVPHA